ncbi:MAG: dihydroorotate dehydrogenase [Saccharofermentanales bacterium]|jgi:dihydroorotate dehydrogenase (NAD+) catalytic subunit
MEVNTVDPTVTIGGLKLKNPVITASGTFGFGRELAEWFDLAELGAMVSKGVTRLPRLGNSPPRVAETAAGMLNSVGLQNPGLERFIAEELPFMLAAGTTVVVNVAGDLLEDYIHCCQTLDSHPVDAIELNLSCPNVAKGCMTFGADAESVRAVVAACRAVTDKPLWVKLTPNVTSVSEIAMAAEAGGADAVSLINTLMGMVIDRRSRRPLLHNNTGGLSGPAIKPVALRMVAEVARAVKIPVIGMGGITTGADAIDFMIAGAAAVQVGTATLVKPTAALAIKAEMLKIAAEDGVSRLADYTGTLELWT